MIKVNKTLKNLEKLIKNLKHNSLFWIMMIILFIYMNNVKACPEYLKLIWLKIPINREINLF